MMKLIRELRRREVFRTAGLYVGIAWILIETASVLLNAFEAPDWILRAMIILAIIGLPVTIVLAWIFDITEGHIEVQADATDTVVIPFGGRRTDFVVIGVLSVALVFSVYLNLRGDAETPEALTPVSVLIADFENKTGSDIFDGLLEQALNVGIESAPHITSYQRNNAKTIATGLEPNTTTLDPPMASLVAVREGINLVLTGSIAPASSGFELSVAGMEPKGGVQLFNIEQKADSTEAVLVAIGELSGAIRKELGDATLDKSESPFAETFTAASLEAARAYVNGGQLAFAGNHEAAIEAYQEAIRLDENFGRAYASLGLSAHRVGLSELSGAAWQKALSMMDTMTERERLRTLGVYYTSVTRNYQSAIENFSSLVEKYPADAPGHNNLAVVYFYTLDFGRAREQGAKLLDIYPTSTLYRSNYALYAMYASEFEAASEEARRVIDEDPTFYKGYLPQAIAAIDRGDFDAAAEAYANMKLGGPRGESLATVGFADLSAYRGQFAVALRQLQEGIPGDQSNMRAVARKQIMAAEVHLQLGDQETAVEWARRALELYDGDDISVLAALIFLASGDTDAAKAIADRLSGMLQPQRRAYGSMLAALLDMEAGDTVGAIDRLTQALELADLWLIRLQLGRAYLQAGYAAEALAEFEAARSRRGEASALFLDDVPTMRYVAELPYWTALAQREIGMTDAARQNLQQFLDLRPEGGLLHQDALEQIGRD